MKAFYNDYEQLREDLLASKKSFDMELIDKAYNLAASAHESQRRVSGIPYILHPTSVACILVELGMDTQSIAAALLHDVVEDTSHTIADIEKMFGAEIANLVDGVTKLGKLHFTSHEEQQAENIRKMLIAMSEDIRVIIIKLADRLHNMRTISCMNPQKRRDSLRICPSSISTRLPTRRSRMRWSWGARIAKSCSTSSSGPWSRNFCRSSRTFAWRRA